MLFFQKHLGLIIDDQPNSDEHIQNKTSKYSKMIGIVKRLSVIPPRDDTLTN